MFKKNQILFGKIKEINSKNIMMNFENYHAIIYINEISDYFIQNINSFFKVGEKIFVKIYKINHEEKMLYCSYKELMPNFLKEPFDYIIEETSKGFLNLKEKTNKELKKWKESN